MANIHKRKPKRQHAKNPYAKRGASPPSIPAGRKALKTAKSPAHQAREQLDKDIAAGLHSDENINAIALAIAGEKDWENTRKRAVDPNGAIDHYHARARAVVEVMEKNGYRKAKKW